MRREFTFGHIKGARNGDAMQFHSYELRKEADAYTLKFKERLSTNAAGITRCLGLQADTNVKLQAILKQIEIKLPHSRLLTVGGTVPVPHSADLEADES